MIITNNEDALRIKCEDVLPEEVGTLVATLEAELDYANRLGNPGIGLAAPQIGIAKKIAIVRLNKLSINLVNCKIDKAFSPALFKDEGCLSFPGRVENTTRFQEIHITDNLVTPYKFIATGLVAVVCQHELDHLNSVLFIDHKISEIKKKRIGPNDMCSCGSMRKFKKCCMKVI